MLPKKAFLSISPFAESLSASTTASIWRERHAEVDVSDAIITPNPTDFVPTFWLFPPSLLYPILQTSSPLIAKSLSRVLVDQSFRSLPVFSLTSPPSRHMPIALNTISNIKQFPDPISSGDLAHELLSPIRLAWVSKLVPQTLLLTSPNPDPFSIFTLVLPALSC